ncbi:hypothetical protein PBI_HOMINES_33 [Mycobacterium phage Homines]|nr:hypothetical protein PBI_HOMINES_33 [Mycobacterium phage Homines]
MLMIDVDDYTVNLTSHTTLANIPSGAIIAVSESLTGKSVTSDGWVRADPTVFPEVTGDTGEAVIVYKHTGTSSTSTLLSYHDSPTYQFVIPNGSDIRVVWSTDGNTIHSWVCGLLRISHFLASLPQSSLTGTTPA